jgi:pimeloyl-ACP methyl ester carboxylesterase
VPVVTAADGVRLSYELEGAGPPVLLHLGSGCDSRLWRAAGYLPRLSQSHTCILFDHRGHGASDHPIGPEANHLDRLAEDVITVLDELAIESTAFWGYSNGFIIGLKVADDHPERISSLVMSGVLWRTTPEELAESIPAAVANYRAHGWDPLIAEFVDEEGPIPDWMRESIRETDVEHVIGFTESRPTWGWDEWESLRRVAVPTLILTGELEDPDDTMLQAAAAMKDAERVRIPGKGHINGFLDSGFALPIVLEFLGSHI